MHHPPRHLLLLTLLYTLLLPSSAATSAEYESKIQKALHHYSTHIDSLTTTSHAKLDDDGMAHLDFRSMAIENEINRLNLLKYQLGIDGDSKDSDDDEEEAPVETYVDDSDVQKERMIKQALDPDEWYRYSYWELHAYFSCAYEFTKSKPIPSTERWNEIRSYYHTFVLEDLEDWPLQEGEGPRSYVYTEGEYSPPMEAFQSGFKGRGLRANRLITKGELVFKATNNTIIFTHGHTWRKFLFALYERNGEGEDELDGEMACDVLVWSWIQQLVPGGPLVIVMDLDNGSLMNEGREDPGWEKPNVKCGKEDWCDFEYYAIKDIQEGEEILCDYREFAYLDAWKHMGL